MNNEAKLTPYTYWQVEIDGKSAGVFHIEQQIEGVSLLRQLDGSGYVMVDAELSDRTEPSPSVTGTILKSDGRARILVGFD